MAHESILNEYRHKWGLSQMQILKSTPAGSIYKVQHGSDSAILKILSSLGQREEARGFKVLKHLNGHGAVHIYEMDERAALMEVAMAGSLRERFACKQDFEATHIVCDVLEKLHGVPVEIDFSLPDLETHFASLFAYIQRGGQDPQMREGAVVARRLLESQREIVLLHGDIHHDNILYSSQRGWLAIDAKGVIGERTYDVANIFYNPLDQVDLITRPEVIESRARVLSERLQLDKTRILEFAMAYGCLSAAWYIEDQQDFSHPLKVAACLQKILGNI